MRTAIITITVIVAFFATAYGAPAPDKAVDWHAVGVKVLELRQVVGEAVDEIRTTANNDNREIGQIIEQKLAVGAEAANQIFNQAIDAISNETLTIDQARTLFHELQGILVNLQNELRDHVNQLSPAAQEKIRSALTTALDQAEFIAREILALLDTSSDAIATVELTPEALAIFNRLRQ